jgi:hypothetical protein
MMDEDDQAAGELNNLIGSRKKTVNRIVDAETNETALRSSHNHPRGADTAMRLP